MNSTYERGKERTPENAGADRRDPGGSSACHLEQPAEKEMAVHAEAEKEKMMEAVAVLC